MPAEFHPPLLPAWWWWLVAAAFALAGLALGGVCILLWRRSGRSPDPAPDAAAEARERALGRIDAAVSAHEESQLPAGAAARCIGLAAREFVGIVTGRPVDAWTAPQLREEAMQDPRLEPLATLAADVETSFNSGSEPDVTGLAVQAREVVSEWS